MMKRGRGQGRVVVAAAVLAALMAVSVRPAAAAQDDNNRFATDFGFGVAAFFTNLVYMPTKFVYATLGGITGGFAYVLTGFDYKLARDIWVPSTGGDYVVTPSMLRGECPIYFSGATRPEKCLPHSPASERSEEDLGTSGQGGKATSY